MGELTAATAPTWTTASTMLHRPMSQLELQASLLELAPHGVLAMNWSIIAASLIAFSMLAWQLQADESTAAESAAAASTSADFNIRDRLEAHCIDGSILKVRLLDAKIPLKTDYGIFEISSVDIRRIEFANRISDELARQLKAAVAKLGDDDYHVREAATGQLLSMQQLAYPALVAAAQSEDA